MSVFVIGKSGLLGNALRDQAGWAFLSHREAFDDTGWVNRAGCIINCAFSPALRHGPYQETEDVDLALARIIGDRPCNYIMLSSRAVYGPSDAMQSLSETDIPRPTNHYAKNKLHIENALQSLLQERLTILRLSTMFGMELHRPSFFGIAMTGLLERGVITLDMNPAVERDFYAVRQFAEDLPVIAHAPRPGLYNLGSGVGTACGRIAEWLIEGFGRGTYTAGTEMKDPFRLDMAKTRSAWPALPVMTPEDIREDTLRCGRWLAAQS